MIRSIPRREGRRIGNATIILYTFLHPAQMSAIFSGDTLTVMSNRKRKGMLIKNTNFQTVTINMATRTISLDPGEEELVTAEEVLDTELRDFLQVRGVSIVRPALDDEEEELRARLG
ncbi:MAG: hypothetical protein O2797_05785 [Bacteroidetes bacterium]|nr:hypothetical protein [Bacteroidota bacterium]MDA1333713.1 hypothetical protein [Bacteroidota bacterium]